MGRGSKVLFLVFVFTLLCAAWSWEQEVFGGNLLTGDRPGEVTATDSTVLISSYFNSADPRDEWSELLVVADKVDMRNWSLQDNNAAQTAFQPQIIFNNIPFWNNMRGGTIIMIWHRPAGTTGISHPTVVTKQAGYIEISANDPAYFNGGSFGTAPLYAGNTLNIAGGGDLLELLNGSGTFIHALGHKTAYGSSWTPLPSPKLNYKASLADGEAVFVCPGSKTDEYGFLSPQDGTTYTVKSSTDLSFGLPNCSAVTSANSDYWRWVRQPQWINPVMNGTVNTANTVVTLTWNSALDPNPADGVQGYLLVRNTANLFGTPADGHVYAAGDNLGGATVMAIIPSSQTITFADNTTVPCSGGFFYRIFAFRYRTDTLGNDYNPARGRAYNETSFGAAQVLYPAATTPVAAQTDRTGFCEDDPGNITLSATGGSGNTLNWYAGSCGGTLTGIGSGANNSITIPSPAATTTYFARWENSCGVSSCAQVTATVVPATPVTVSIAATANPVCTGTPVTFTATPGFQGTSPGYQWRVNGSAVGSSTPAYTFTPSNGDVVTCTLTSSEPCASGNPVTSNTILMSVSTAIPVSVSITADANPVCTGTPVNFSATPVYPGTLPVYQWAVNGTNQGTNSQTFSWIPANGDIVTCLLTSNGSCASGNPATSNAITMTVSSSMAVGVTITANTNTVCQGTTADFKAHPTNQGLNPQYQWTVNGGNQGPNSQDFTWMPANGDVIACTLTSDASCASGNPATSANIIMIVNTPALVSLAIAASENPVCSGNPVTFTATPSSQGNTPVFQWKVNGIDRGTNDKTFLYIPSDGDNVACILTSDVPCATGSPATSNTIVMELNPTPAVSVRITAVPGTTVCAGTAVTYSATTTHGGNSPLFRWFLNGQPAGSNSPLFTQAAADGDSVYCTVTSDEPCAGNNPFLSDTLITSVSAALSATVTITANHVIFCPGTLVAFSAAPVNEGATPVYEWLVDGSQVQKGSSTVYITQTLSPGQKVECRLTSSLSCVTQQTVSSLPLSLAFAPPPSLVLTNKDFLCAGETATLDAGENFISYTWHDGSTSRYMDVTHEGIYWVVASDSLGCTASDSVLVKKCSGNVFVPDAFSPDGNGLNDIFRIYANPDEITDFSMLIFTRWGEQVFETNNMLNGWNGLRQGQFCPEGTYIWTIRYKSTAAGAAAGVVTLNGAVELVR